MKKIGIVCYPTFGGSGIVATELGKVLSEKNYFVHFISYESPVRLGTLKKNFSFCSMALLHLLNCSLVLFIIIFSYYFF